MSSEQTYLLSVEYDGTALCGFQQQSNGRTVQGELRRALQRLLGVDVALRGASRTDSGVHALAMPVSVRVATRIPLRGLLLGVNSLLPEDVAVTNVKVVPDDFDARDASRGKHYRYDIWDASVASPHRRHYVWWLRYGRLDVAAMQAAAAHFVVGEIDYSSFRAVGCDSVSVNRCLWRVDVARVEPSLVRVSVEGNAFLRNMVRILAGTLADVGHGRRAPDDIPRILAARDRRAAGPTAPPHGLTLVEVFYDPPVGERPVPPGAAMFTRKPRF